MRNLITSTLFLLITVTLLQAQGLEVNQGTDVTNTDEKNGYVIIGDETGANIVLDDNEIQIKNKTAALTSVKSQTTHEQSSRLHTINVPRLYRRVHYF